MEADIKNTLQAFDLVSKATQDARAKLAEQLADIDPSDNAAIVAAIADARASLAATLRPVFVPDRKFLIGETIERLQIEGVRSQLMELDHELLFDLCERLTRRQVTAADALRWLRDQPGCEDMDDNVIYRFGNSFRKKYAELRDRFAGLPVVEAVRPRSLAAAGERRLRPIRSIKGLEALSDADAALVARAASSVKTEGLAIELSPDELKRFCLIVASEQGKRAANARRWLELQTGKRVHHMTAQTLADRFTDRFRRLGGTTAAERREAERRKNYAPEHGEQSKPR